MGILSGLRAVAGRTASVIGIRSASDRPGRRVQHLYDAVAPESGHPMYRNPSPSDLIPDQRAMSAAVRAMMRNNPRIQALIEKKLEIAVGTGPRPKTRFKELLELWNLAKDSFDTRDERDFAAWLAEDVLRNLEVDGEVFIRVRRRRGQSIYGELSVPIQFQALTSEFVDPTFEGVLDGYAFRNGVAVVNDRKIAFAVWTEHPDEAVRNGREARRVALTPVELFHVLRSSTGNPRGEVPLASAIGVMEDLADLESAELQRKKNATALATYFEQGPDPDVLEKGGVPGAPTAVGSDEYKQMRNLRLRSGDHVLLPPGIRARQIQAAGEATGHAAGVKLLASLVCNLVGIPYYEGMNDWSDVAERAMRPAGTAMKRRILRDRARLEKQALAKIWRAFVTTCITEGLWTPPPGATQDEIFRVAWRWPVVQTISIERELKSMWELVKSGLYAPEDYVEDYVGQDYAENTRRWTQNVARARAMGSTVFSDVWDDTNDVTASIVAEVEEEEAYERSLVDRARLDRSALNRD